MLQVVLHGFWPCVTDSTWRNQEYLRTVVFCTFFKKCYKAQCPAREPSVLQPTRWESMRNKGGQMVGEVLSTLTLWLEVSPIWDDHKFQKPERVSGMNLWVGESMFMLGEAHASDRNPRVHGFFVTLSTWNHMKPSYLSGTSLFEASAGLKLVCSCRIWRKHTKAYSGHSKGQEVKEALHIFSRLHLA